MLPRENLRWRKQRPLTAVCRGNAKRIQRHRGLSGAHVPLHQPVHGNGALHIRINFVQHALLRACQAMALIRGRDFVTPDDVKYLAVPVLAHRVALSGLYGRTAKSEEIIREALSQTEAPVESCERT